MKLLSFGDGQTTTGADTDANHYATLDHDTATNSDYAQYRQYANMQGRWLSPDPYSGSYKKRNPQSFNRYVYGGNNPLAMVDHLGLDDGCDDTQAKVSATAGKTGPHAGDSGEVCPTVDSGGGGGGSDGGGSGDGSDGSDVTAGNGSNDGTGSDGNSGTSALTWEPPTIDTTPIPTETLNTTVPTEDLSGDMTGSDPSNPANAILQNLINASSKNAPLNDYAKAIFTTIANSFPSWLSANYFPTSVCNTAKVAGALSLLVGIGAPASAPVTAPVATVSGLVVLVGCPW